MAQKYIILIGCGRLGCLLASRFSQNGHSLVVIDSNPAVFGNLSPDFSGFTIEGDATELSVLSKANISKADAVFALTDNDNINLMVAQVASSIYKVNKVIARVYDPKREVVFSNMNIATICPTLLAADAFITAADF